MSNKMCNDCWLSMQNCRDRSICCEMDEYDGDQCDWFEPMHIVHGHWIDMGDFEQCSVCKATHLKEFNSFYGKVTWIRTAYCPHCGAKMDEVKE